MDIPVSIDDVIRLLSLTFHDILSDDFRAHLGFIHVHYNNISVDGDWSQWSNWTSCSTSCGIGSHIRRRSCSNPTPQHGGDNCMGNDTQTHSCFVRDCPGLNKFRLTPLQNVNGKCYD